MRDKPLSAFTALFDLFSVIIAAAEGSDLSCAALLFFFRLRRHQNRNPIRAIITTPPTTTPAIIGVLWSCEAVTFAVTGATVVVGVEVLDADVEVAVVDVCIDVLSDGIFINCAASRSAAGQPTGVAPHGLDLQQP
jgi:hypothetical protein